MALTVQELQSGMTYWRETRWPQDFHNQFYIQMAQANPNGIFNIDWWNTFLPVLRQWRATRPRSTVYLTERIQHRFQELTDKWAQNIEPNINGDIECNSWGDIASFPSIVAQIKNVTSPVFTSKFCHFLAPDIFPVIDNAAMGNPFPTYQSYYDAGRVEWLETDESVQVHLIEILGIAVGRELFAEYPLKCKIIELCLIGRHQG